MRVINNKPVVKCPTNNEKMTPIVPKMAIAPPTPDTPIVGLTTYLVNSAHTNARWRPLFLL